MIKTGAIWENTQTVMFAAYEQITSLPSLELLKMTLLFANFASSSWSDTQKVVFISSKLSITPSLST